MEESSDTFDSQRSHNSTGANIAMEKRSLQTEGDGETTASLIQEQMERSKRRRTIGNGRGNGTRRSVWSSVAASVRGQTYICNACGREGRLNAARSNWRQFAFL